MNLIVKLAKKRRQLIIIIPSFMLIIINAITYFPFHKMKNLAHKKEVYLQTYFIDLPNISCVSEQNIQTLNF